VLRPPSSDLLGFAYAGTSLGRARRGTGANRRWNSLVALPGSKRRYGPECVTGKGTFELRNRAHSLCLTRNHAERGQLVKSVPSDCVLGGVTLRATIQNRLIGPSNVQTISELFCSAPAGFNRAFQLLSLNQIE
jgi:hypothetical protein